VPLQTVHEPKIAIRITPYIAVRDSNYPVGGIIYYPVGGIICCCQGQQLPNIWIAAVPDGKMVDRLFIHRWASASWPLAST